MSQDPQGGRSRKADALLFVNKGIESGQLSRSGTSTEAFRINSFVQTRRRRLEGTLDDGEDSSRTTDVRPESEQHSGAEFHALIRNFDPRTRGLEDARTLSSFYPTNNSLDPFNAAVVPINSKTLQLLQYAFSSFSRRSFMAETLPPPSDRATNLTFRHDNFVRARLERCIEDSMLMDATLAVGVTCAGWTTDNPDFEKPLEFFLGRAIHAVRIRLAASNRASSDQWLLLSIYSLSISTLWLGLARARVAASFRQAISQHEGRQYLDTAALHLKVAKDLVAEAGGMKNLDPYVMSSLILGDKYLAVCRMQPPVLSLDWDPGPREPPLVPGSGYNSSSLTGLGTNLTSLLDTQIVDPSLAVIINDTIDYLQASRSIWNHIQPDHDTEQWLFLRAQALCHRLLSQQNLNLTEECVRTTTLTFLISIARYQGMQMSIKLLAPQLADLLVRFQAASRLDDHDVHRGLVFWTVCTAGVACVASGNTHDTVFSDLRAQAISIGQTIGLSTDVPFEDYSALLTKYLFLPGEQGRELRGFLSVDFR